MSLWENDKRVAATILHNRPLRRKWLARFLILDLAGIVVGLWVLDGWLAEKPVYFLIWWAGCGLLTLWVLLFALYDAMRAIQEQRDL